MLQILSGTVLKGTYRIDRMIGRGSMSLVYRVTHLGLDQAMAVKLLSPDALTTPQSFARFKREAMVVSGVKHPAMVHVIDFGEEQGTPYIVMEYVDGIDLAEYIPRKGPMAPRQAVAVMRQLVSLLRTMHGQGIIHRNLKPRNIWVLQDGEEDGQLFVKVLAFSLATVFDEPNHSEIQGTNPYMAPELLAGGQIDERTDLYAAGLVFQEMLSGEQPRPTSLLTLLQGGARPLPPAMPVPNVVRQTLRTFCEERPQDRFQSAAEEEHALRACEDALRPTRPSA
jgi:serine/threonine-protein kinase